MKLILVSDIFGRTPPLEKIKEELSAIVGGTSIVDPYDGKFLSFENEDHAYRHFMSLTGIEAYQAILKNHIRQVNKPLILIGFSVGASVIWKLSDSRGLPPVKKAFGFYGSQIRNMTTIDPLFDIELIFPKKEPHFDVDNLIRKLEIKPNVTCLKAGADHGFMNHLSNGFDRSAYDSHMDLLKKSLK